MRLPKIFSEYENEVREAINSLVSRGKLFVTVALDDNGITPQTLKLNEEVAKLYYKMFSDLKKRFKLAGEISINHFTGLPDLFSTVATSSMTKEEVTKLIAGIRKALDSLNRMRQNEGAALARDMANRVKLLEKSVDLISSFHPQSIERYRQKLAELLQEMLPQGEATKLSDETRLRLDMEVAIMADKADVTEECVRLRSHCEAFIAAIKAPGDSGKRLNFILQEMNREANTIGSKSVIYEISAEVIKVREEIEKLREQVQNIE